MKTDNGNPKPDDRDRISPPMTEEKIERIEAKAKKATKGPWTPKHDSSTYAGGEVYAELPDNRRDYICTTSGNAQANADFFAATDPDTILELIADNKSQEILISDQAAMDREMADLRSENKRLTKLNNDALITDCEPCPYVTAAASLQKATLELEKVTRTKALKGAR